MSAPTQKILELLSLVEDNIQANDRIEQNPEIALYQYNLMERHPGFDPSNDTIDEGEYAAYSRLMENTFPPILEDFRRSLPLGVLPYRVPGHPHELILPIPSFDEEAVTYGLLRTNKQKLEFLVHRHRPDLTIPMDPDLIFHRLRIDTDMEPWQDTESFLKEHPELHKETRKRGHMMFMLLHPAQRAYVRCVQDNQISPENLERELDRTILESREILTDPERGIPLVLPDPDNPKPQKPHPENYCGYTSFTGEALRVGLIEGHLLQGGSHEYQAAKWPPKEREEFTQKILEIIQDTTQGWIQKIQETWLKDNLSQAETIARKCPTVPFGLTLRILNDQTGKLAQWFQRNPDSLRKLARGLHNGCNLERVLNDILAGKQDSHIFLRIEKEHEREQIPHLGFSTVKKAFQLSPRHPYGPRENQLRAQRDRDYIQGLMESIEAPEGITSNSKQYAKLASPFGYHDLQKIPDEFVFNIDNDISFLDPATGTCKNPDRVQLERITSTRPNSLDNHREGPLLRSILQDMEGIHKTIDVLVQDQTWDHLRDALRQQAKREIRHVITTRNYTQAPGRLIRDCFPDPENPVETPEIIDKVALHMANSITYEFSHLLLQIRDTGLILENTQKTKKTKTTTIPEIPANLKLTAKDIVTMGRLWQTRLGNEIANARSNAKRQAACRFDPNAQAHGGPSWESPQLMAPSGWEVTPLTSADMLEEEGNHMEHCIGSYVGRAIQGPEHFYHLEHETKDPDLRATIHLIFKKQWQLREAEGIQNRTPPRKTLQAIQTMVSNLQHQEDQGLRKNQAKQEETSRKRARKHAVLEGDPIAEEYAHRASRKILLQNFPKLAKIARLGEPTQAPMQEIMRFHSHSFCCETIPDEEPGIMISYPYANFIALQRAFENEKRLIQIHLPHQQGQQAHRPNNPNNNPNQTRNQRP